MKLVILNSKSRYRPEDQKALEAVGAVFYQNHSTKLTDISEFQQDDSVVLGVQPSWIANNWEGLKWEELKKYHTLKGLCLSTTAYGWVPFKELGQKGIPVANVPDKSTDAVSEYYVMMMLALLRKLPKVIRNDWKFSYEPEYLGTNAKGLQVGIIGMGKIGSQIADLCHAFGMKVTYWNRSPKKSQFTYLDLPALCQSADVLFIATVADESTKNLVDKALLSSLKPTAIVLSPVDPIVYDQPYLIERVSNGELGGLGIESKQKTLLDYSGNVLVAPELAYFTQQTLDRESAIMTEAMLAMVAGKPKYVVNQ